MMVTHAYVHNDQIRVTSISMSSDMAHVGNLEACNYFDLFSLLLFLRWVLAV
jgi:hypothetical protein